jgi:hypothetical protein
MMIGIVSTCGAHIQHGHGLEVAIPIRHIAGVAGEPSSKMLLLPDIILKLLLSLMLI